MGSDRARLRADVTQRYRRPVFQQGRVTLEADLNEAHQWIGDELEAETVDIVGPCGTPDDGYLIVEAGQPKPPRGIAFAAGTMYVGGLRVTTDGLVDFAPQDPKQAPPPNAWLDRGAVPPAPMEYVWLHLIETEVSAVEDVALRESALGGPDTAQRIRLLQRIERRKTTLPNCTDALDELKKSWIADGLQFDDHTMRLRSKATLQVKYTQPPVKTDLCEPTAHGGYLGAENQLIRVQITGGTHADGFQVAWGFDDASFLYPITFANGGTTAIKLGTQPVDAAHWPRAGQALELLQATAKLANGRYVAAPDGQMHIDGNAYDSTSGTITFAVPVTLAPSPQLFLRVWEELTTLPAGSANNQIPIGTTGITVTLSAPSGRFHVGDYWQFAVRPFTDQQIVPIRYTDAPQPPEGAREWFCPLGIVTWSKDGKQNDVYTLTADCREHFDDLVVLTKRKAGSGCCTVSVSPADFTSGDQTLQKLIDALPRDVPALVCLGPGTYELPASLRIPKRAAELTIEGCPGGVTLAAVAGAEASFIDGLVVVASVDGVTLRNLQFDPLPVPQDRSGFLNNATAFVSPQARSLVAGTAMAIGVRAISCSALTIDRCTFTLPTPPSIQIVAAGIFAGSTISDVRVTHCAFRCASGATSTEVAPLRIFIGYAQAQTLLGLAKLNTPVQVIDSRLDGAAFDDNVFDGLTYGVLVHAAFGSVRVHRNRITRSFAGFLFYDAVPRSVVGATRPVMGLLQLSGPYMFTITLLSRYPLPQGADPNSLGPPAVTLTLPSPPGPVLIRTLAAAPIGDTLKTGAADQFSVAVLTPPPAPPPMITLFRPEIDRAVDIEMAFAATVPPVPTKVPGFDIAHNDGLVGIAGIGGVAVGEPALNIEFDVRQPGSELRLTANKFGSTNPFTITVLIYQIDTATVTGNEMANYGRNPSDTNLWTTSRPFWLAPPFVANRAQLDRVAITGNVFSGIPALPPRLDALAAAAAGKYPVGLADWYFLNTTMPVGELEP